MAEWKKNNRACTTTWTTLRVLGQNDLVFKDSGNVEMNKLTFWNQTTSSDLREIQARALAIQIDNIFRMIRKAEYEDGIDTENAIDSICDALTTEAMTISELAEVNDSLYLFWGEDEISI